MLDYKAKSISLFHGVFSVEALKKVKKLGHIFVCEGRPSLEAGKKVSAYFIKQGATPTVICDNMAGFLFFKGLVKEVVLSAQFVDKTGALCDMGSLILAVLAKKHKVSVRILEGERKNRFLGDPKDILKFEGVATAPKNVQGYVPLVEWVPSKYLR